MDETLAFLALAAAGGGSIVATQYSFVYRPGGVAHDNVYTTWPALYAALNLAAPVSPQGNRPPTLIQIDDSVVSPAPVVIPAAASPYNLDGVTFVGVADINSNTGLSVLNIADGAHIQPGGILTFSSVEVHYLGTATPCILNSSAAQISIIYCFGGGSIESDAAGVFLDVTDGFGSITSEFGALGDGTHALGTATAPGILNVEGYVNTFVAANALTGGAQTRLFWDNNVPGAQGGGVAVTQVNGYVPTTPANWASPPTTQSTALDEIASALSNHAQADVTVVGPASPLTSSTLSFTPRVSGLCRVFATACVSSAGADDSIFAVLWIDGAGVVGAPQPEVTATTVGDKVQLTIEWDVQLTLAAHTFAIRTISGSVSAMTGELMIVKVQELLK